jgi:hypothetical protein
MVQETIKVKSGQSKAGAGKNTVAAALLGDKSANKAVNKAIWGTATRNYTRNKQVWSCGNVGCATAGASQFSGNGGGIVSKFFTLVFQGIIMIALLFAAVLIFA